MNLLLESDLVGYSLQKPPRGYVGRTLIINSLECLQRMSEQRYKFQVGVGLIVVSDVERYVGHLGEL